MNLTKGTDPATAVKSPEFWGYTVGATLGATVETALEKIAFTNARQLFGRATQAQNGALVFLDSTGKPAPQLGVNRQLARGGLAALAFAAMFAARGTGLDMQTAQGTAFGVAVAALSHIVMDVYPAPFLPPVNPAPAPQ